MLKDILEDVGDNLFNKDPYYQQGGDMVRSAAWATRSIRQQAEIGEPHFRHDPADHRRSHRPGQDYVVAGWASVNEGTEGPPIDEVVVKDRHFS